MKKIIGVDLDGVLVDFDRSYIALFIDVTGKDLFPPRPFDIPCYDYPQHYGYTLEDMNAVWDVILESPNFWQRLSPYTDIFASTKYLNDELYAGADLYFVTSRPGLTSKTQTEMWLWQQGFKEPTVLISSQKGMCSLALKFTHYIDDRLENVLSVVGTGSGKAVLMNRPWNQQPAIKDVGFVRTNTVVGFAD